MNPAEIESWVSAAAKAFADSSDLDSLKAARILHLGDKAPISLASRSLGSLAPDEKASAGIDSFNGNLLFAAGVVGGGDRVREVCRREGRPSLSTESYGR